MRLSSRTLLLVWLFVLPLCRASSAQSAPQQDKTEVAVKLKEIRGNFKQLQDAAKADHGSCLECHTRLQRECEKWGTYELGISDARMWATRAQQANDAVELNKARHALGEMLLLSLTGKSQKKLALEAERTYAGIIAADAADLPAHFDHARALAWLQREPEAHAEFAYFLEYDPAKNPGAASRITAAKRFAANPSLAAHRMFPALEIKLQDGDVLKTADLQRHLTIYDFWASWCGPCIASMPGFDKLLADHKGQGLGSVSISIDISRSKWRAAVQKYQLRGAQALDEDGSLAATLGVHKVPRFILVDTDGIVLYEGLDTKALSDAVDAASGVRGKS